MATLIRSGLRAVTVSRKRGPPQPSRCGWGGHAASIALGAAEQTELEQEPEAVGHAPVLDHLALDEASDVDDGDRERFAGRWVTQLSTGVGAGASQSRPDGVAGDVDVSMARWKSLAPERSSEMIRATPVGPATRAGC